MTAPFDESDSGSGDAGSVQAHNLSRRLPDSAPALRAGEPRQRVHEGHPHALRPTSAAPACARCMACASSPTAPREAHAGADPSEADPTGANPEAVGLHLRPGSPALRLSGARCCPGGEVRRRRPPAPTSQRWDRRGERQRRATSPRRRRCKRQGWPGQNAESARRSVARVHLTHGSSTARCSASVPVQPAPNGSDQAPRERTCRTSRAPACSSAKSPPSDRRHWSTRRTPTTRQFASRPPSPRRSAPPASR